jgi:uncharacterized membrane protein YphA (DoxX/SURF4 family)
MMDWAYLAAYSALIGGLCLILGLFTRMSSILLLILGAGKFSIHGG